MRISSPHRSPYSVLKARVAACRRSRSARPARSSAPHFARPSDGASSIATRQRSPTRRASRPASGDRSRAAEALQLLEAVTGHKHETLFTTAATLGLRQGELLGLPWSDLHLERRTVAIRQALQRVDGEDLFGEPKTDRSRRTLPLPAFVTASLQQHRTRQLERRLAAGALWTDSGLVFTNDRSGPLVGSTVTHQLYDVLEAAELPPVSFHDLRHTPPRCSWQWGCRWR